MKYCEICGKQLKKDSSKRCYGCSSIGRKLSKETKMKIGKSNKGKLLGIKRPPRNKEWCANLSLSRRGTVSPKWIKVMKLIWERHKGSGNPNWKGGVSTEYHLARTSPKYKQWCQDVFKRDNYTCTKCGDNNGGNLNAHHIKTFAKYPKLRYKVNNGITLCEQCHRKEHYGKVCEPVRFELSKTRIY